MSRKGEKGATKKRKSKKALLQNFKTVVNEEGKKKKKKVSLASWRKRKSMLKQRANTSSQKEGRPRR